MFSKLLKYDNRSIFKYWWIAALSSLFIAIVGGICIRIVDTVNPIYGFIQVVAVLGAIFAVFGLMLLPLLTEILIIVRFYKHFFTDEGYLTFTLPVKKTTLLNSKLVMTLIFMLSSMVIFFIDLFIVLAIGLPAQVFAHETWATIGEFVANYFDFFSGYGVAYIILVVLILIASIATQMLFIFLCITIAATITRKYKVLVAIAIYYGANMVMSMIVQILTYGGLFTVIGLISELQTSAACMCAAAALFGLLGTFVAVGAGLYLIQLRMLDKKLNLE